MQTVQELPPAPVEPMPPVAAEAKVPQQKVIMPLTGLRFLPLMAIVWHHSRDRFTFMEGYAENVSFVHGVCFFFVLSGFILTYRYNYVKDVGTSFHFYLARIARLWPMHVFCLSLLLFLLPEVFRVKGDLVPVFFCNLFMLHSWVPIWKYYFSFNGPSWSSATLQFFDVFFPFLFLGAKKSWTLVLSVTAAFVLIMISASNMMHLPLSDPTHPCFNGMVYINPLARLLEFSTGIVAALAFQKYAHRFKLGATLTTIVEVAILGLIVWINLNSHAWKAAVTPWATPAGALWIHNSGIAFIPFALLIMELATEKGLVSKFFGTKWMGVLGDMSFSLYMLHGVWIAYFGVNFHDETSPAKAWLFYASLLVAAHLMHNFIIQPIRMQFLKHGTKLLSLKWAPPPRPPSKKKPKTAEQIMRKRLSLAAEVALCIGLIYAALPTINRITPAEATTIAADSSVQNVQFGSMVKCDSASAKSTARGINVSTVWEALQPQNVDLNMVIEAQDKSGKVIGISNYKQDGEHQRVGKGTIWLDEVRVPCASADVASVSIKVTNGRKRKILQPSINGATDATKVAMTVPVVAGATSCKDEGE